MLSKKEKMVKIIQVLIVFVVIDFIASSFLEINNVFGIILYLISASLIIIYGFYLLLKRDDYLLKTYFYFIIFLGIIKILLRVINQ